MSPNSQIVDILLQWCAENDVWIDPRLQIHTNEKTGTAIYTKNNNISVKSSLVHIHRNAVLSIRSCCLSDEIEPETSGPLAQLSLSLALYAELLLGDSSRWSGYLQSLPKKLVPLPLFWNYRSYNDDDLADGREGLEWLRGTEVERQFSRHPEQSLERIDEYYTTVAEPLLLRRAKRLNPILKMKPSLDGFYHAYALVSSRAFLVDAYHGLSMVPIADIFNHSQENHAHLESEFDVCCYCGLLEQCPHDADEPLLERPSQLRVDSSTNQEKNLDFYYEMVSVRSIQPNEEIYNTYGETLSNAQLLAQYGFVLDVNENDRLHWDFTEVYKFCNDFSNSFPLEPPEMESAWRAVLRCMDLNGMSRHINKSSVVSLHAGTWDNCLNIDGEGRISYQLWVLLALPTCLSLSPGGLQNRFADAIVNLDAALELLLAMEDSLETNGDPNDDDRGSSPERVAILVGLARSLMNLCAIRRFSLGKQLADMENPNDVLDEIPVESFRTRDAINIVISERSILDSCTSLWGDIAISFYQ